MNELDRAAMEAFIDRNGYKRLRHEFYRGEMIYYAERHRVRDGMVDFFWSTMGFRRHIEFFASSERATRLDVAKLDARAHVDSKIDVLTGGTVH